MIVIRDNERLYLNNFNYNTCRLITKLAEIVKSRGGRIKPNKTAMVSNRNTSNEPIQVTHTTYISFVLDDMYYYYQIDDNPFFDFYYQKTPIKNNKRYKHVYLQEDKKEWLYDCFFAIDCNDNYIRDGANMIFNMLINAPVGELYTNEKRIKVNNIYDNGCYYETISNVEYCTIDF